MIDVTKDAVAWRVLVRDTRTTDKTWRPYATYPTEKGAINTVRIIEGEPLEVMVQPLYTSQQPAIPAWQPIETAPTGVWVLACNGGVVYIARLHNTERWFNTRDIECSLVTHWMPIPAPPKAQEEIKGSNSNAHFWSETDRQINQLRLENEQLQERLQNIQDEDLKFEVCVEQEQEIEKLQIEIAKLEALKRQEAAPLTDAEIDSCRRPGLIDSLLDPYDQEGSGDGISSVYADLREFARAIEKRIKESRNDRH